MERTFDTPGPAEIFVELGRGSLTVTSAEVSTTTVRVTGAHAEEVAVEQDGRRVSVVAPRQRIGFFGGGEPSVDVEITAPRGSDLVARTGSADQTARGTFGQVRVKSGSGDVEVEATTGALAVDTGSGDVTLGTIGGELRSKCGSGDLEARRVDGDAAVSTGSGDVTIDVLGGNGLLKSGSGTLRVGRAEGDLSLSTASGDVVVDTQARGGVSARNVSGDVRIGVPAGIPVWTDVSTVTGRIGSDLAGAGRPAPGEDHLEVRATTVSGDIALTQL